MYVRPEILEVGWAESVTLGTVGTAMEKCECGRPAEEQWISDG